VLKSMYFIYDLKPKIYLSFMKPLSVLYRDTCGC
jgi:hypothetical protein